jgi:hypothetical protein
MARERQRTSGPPVWSMVGGPSRHNARCRVATVRTSGPPVLLGRRNQEEESVRPCTRPHPTVDVYARSAIDLAHLLGNGWSTVHPVQVAVNSARFEPVASRCSCVRLVVPHTTERVMKRALNSCRRSDSADGCRQRASCREQRFGLNAWRAGELAAYGEFPKFPKRLGRLGQRQTVRTGAGVATLDSSDPGRRVRAPPSSVCSFDFLPVSPSSEVPVRKFSEKYFSEMRAHTWIAYGARRGTVPTAPLARPSGATGPYRW